MKRLQDLTPRDITAWRARRQEIGTTKYGETDLWRYGLVDIVEEILDAKNILDRAERRWYYQENLRLDTFKLRNLLNDVLHEIDILDGMLPDSVCTDYTERIWWNESDTETESNVTQSTSEEPTNDEPK